MLTTKPKPENFASELTFGKLWERPAAEAWAQQRWPGCVVYENDTYAHLDFAVVHQGKLVAFVEVKSRRIRSDAFETTIMNLDKHHAARWGAKFLGVETFAVLVFLDTIKVVNLIRKPDALSEIARADRPNVAASLHAEYANAKMEDHSELFDALKEEVRQRALRAEREEHWVQLPLPFGRGVELSDPASAASTERSEG